MCGIWGIISSGKSLNSDKVSKIITKLFVLSETRGKEASGIAVFDGQKTNVLKAAIPGSNLVKTRNFHQFIESINYNGAGSAITFIGHSRLATNGSQEEGDNNQPVYSKNVVAVHNGIVVNVDQLWEKYRDIKREHEVDTEIFVRLLEKYVKELQYIDEAVEKTYMDIAGMASTLSLLLKEQKLIAASNNGSLYMIRSIDGKDSIFASERLILQKLVLECKLSGKFDVNQIMQVKPGKVVAIDLSTFALEEFVLGEHKKQIAKKNGIPDIEIQCQYLHVPSMAGKYRQVNILDEKKLSKYDVDIEPIRKIRRCSKCILPETMPFIKFDEKGVCNYCRTYVAQKYKGVNELYNWANSKLPNKNGIDSIVAFSGGRDSSYGLHYFVKELGLKPVAYSYDWGMVTDLARRNQSRLCSKLGVELIVVSADINRKRANIRKNVLAWLKKPDIGMIPLFMAGDKQYFYYANKVRKDYELQTVLLASNPFEKTYFKAGYCGIMPDILRMGEEKLAMERLPIGSVIKMMGYYIKHYISNPAYINNSIGDTILAALSYYVIPHNYFLLYDYIPWDEEKIDKVLIDEYDWEISNDTESTWRIGDGTSPFYNYVYYLVTGFSENDTLRSNQIREGMLTRERALDLVYRDNQPRFNSIKWYFDTIGLSMYDALEAVSKIRHLY